MITKELLHHLRNDLPVPVTIAALGTDGPTAKRSEGRYRFLCPHCREMLATVNPRNNLAHCFGCKINLNNIDLLMTLGYDFKTAVSILLRMYEQHRSRLPQAEVSAASYLREHHSPVNHPDRTPPCLLSSPDQQRRIPLLQLAQQFGNPATWRPDSVLP